MVTRIDLVPGRTKVIWKHKRWNTSADLVLGIYLGRSPSHPVTRIHILVWCIRNGVLYEKDMVQIDPLNVMTLPQWYERCGCQAAKSIDK